MNKLNRLFKNTSKFILSFRTNIQNYTLHLSCSIFTGTLLLLIGIRFTIHKVNNLLPTSVHNLEKKRCQYIYITENDGNRCQKDEENIQDGWAAGLIRWWSKKKRLLIWRLLEIACTDPSYFDRARAVERLSRIHLSDYDFYTIGAALDAPTAASLARTKNVDHRYFRNPNSRTRLTTMKELKANLRTLLLEVCQEQNHLCLKYFVSKAFPDHLGPDSLSDPDFGNFSQKLLKLSEDTFLQLCLEALVHHSSIGDNIVDVAKRGGLQLLYEVYKHCEGNSEMENLLAKLILWISLYKEFAEDILVTGWIEVLHSWLGHIDQRLSVSAGCTLANLDVISSFGHPPFLGREVLQLYPLEKGRGRGVDVILIHGLLGGVHYTWKQRDPTQTSIPFFAGITSGDKLNINLPNEKCHESHKVSSFKSIDHVADDFDFVFSDLPLSCNVSCNSSLSIPGTSPGTKAVEGDMGEASCCWPLDWLAHDCPNIRLVGLNYETKLTDWLCWCPFKESRMNNTLGGQAEQLLEQLLAADVGGKPTVWIVHSMGGLLLKYMLLRAAKMCKSKPHRKFVHNTKAIIFLSTPHLGSPLACLNEASRFLLLPSALVDQLRLNSGVGVIYEIPLGHLDICKPDSRLSFIYQKVLEITKNVLMISLSS